MAAKRAALTRSSSSEYSALSNIDIHTKPQNPAESPSISRVSVSTPPTSLGDNGSLGSSSSIKVQGPPDASKITDPDDDLETRTIRPRRSRSSDVSSYNLKKLSDAQHPLVNAAAARLTTASSRRNISALTGRTLVHGEEAGDDDEAEGSSLVSSKKTNEASDLISRRPAEVAAVRSSPRIQRRPSVKDRLLKVAGKAATVLGKRSRDVVEAGKRTLRMTAKDEVEVEKQKKLLKELDTGPKGLLDELDLDVEFPAPRPTKRIKSGGSRALKEMAPPAILPRTESAGKRMKAWQSEGIYIGQLSREEPNQKKLQKKRPSSSAGEIQPIAAKSSFMPLPMFSYLENDRDFIIPFDVFAPTVKKGDERPKDWHQINRNRLIGDAKELWEKSGPPIVSLCVCEEPEGDEFGCDDQCLNRIMQYECNDDNCGRPVAECGNRPFAELAQRTKKGGLFDVGVEVLKTPNRGFGVRSCRTFAPGQIIMEYTGEIISEGECQRRMRECYMNKQSYYLMELERGLIIDGTKGSMARFINHSCAPNCEVRMVKVNNTPRMGVFAGENGIATGTELTYDYNFDNFSATRQECFCGASTCRGFLSKRLNATEQKKMAKEESEKKRKAAEEAVKHAEDEERKKKVKTDRGPSWRGWVAVDDPETKEKLRREKREKEEAEKNSVRARRLAARRGSLPSVDAAKPAQFVQAAKRDVKRRKTTTTIELAPLKDSGAAETSATREPTLSAKTRLKHARTTSSGSKFHEDLPMGGTSSRASSTSVVKKITVSEELLPLQDDNGADDEIQLLIHSPKKPSSKRAFKTMVMDEDPAVNLRPEKKKRSSALLDVKDVIKTLGKSVKNGLSGVASSSGGGTTSKMKQSKLNFGHSS